MFNLIKKTIAVCLVGFGLGMLFVILLPLTGWLFTIGVCLVAVGIAWLAC